LTVPRAARYWFVVTNREGRGQAADLAGVGDHYGRAKRLTIEDWLSDRRYHPEEAIHLFYTPKCAYCRAARRRRLLAFWSRRAG
jgi:hypothetical protein